METAASIDRGVSACHQHLGFLNIKPEVERHARIVFREWNEEAREEAIAEAVASAFESYVALKVRGQEPERYSSQLAFYAALHVKDGRHVGGRSSSKDVLSRRTQVTRAFRLVRFSDIGEAWAHAFVDDQTPILDQVVMRIDFPEFMQTLSPRDYRMAWMLAEGFSAKEVADRFGVSSARISQMRQCWLEDWQKFQEEAHGELTSAE